MPEMPFDGIRMFWGGFTPVFDSKAEVQGYPKVHGHPVWFELVTVKGQLAAAGDFYASVLGWQVADSGMQGFTYHLAIAQGGLVGGLMEMPDDVSGMPPAWTIYFGVDDAVRAAGDIRAAGGRIFREPADIPGTGRFAVEADPQGAAFGILAPLPMESGSETQAFDQQKAGHGNWTELMSTDPASGFDFYARLFGWTAGDAMDMGGMGTYQLFRHDGPDIGGMMALGQAPQPLLAGLFRRERGEPRHPADPGRGRHDPAWPARSAGQRPYRGRHRSPGRLVGLREVAS